MGQMVRDEHDWTAEAVCLSQDLRHFPATMSKNRLFETVIEVFNDWETVTKEAGIGSDREEQTLEGPFVQGENAVFDRDILTQEMTASGSHGNIINIVWTQVGDVQDGSNRLPGESDDHFLTNQSFFVDRREYTAILDQSRSRGDVVVNP
jgi:hypothetical protein